jgi:hypothetical protein
MLYSFITRVNAVFSDFCKKNAQSARDNFLKAVNWLPYYYHRSQKIWQEGLYADYLQKKVLDKYVRKIIIYSNNLFSEGLVFRRVVDVYWTLITSPAFLKVVTPFNSPVFNFIWIISILFSLTFLLIIYGYIILQNLLTGAVIN